MNRSRLVRGQIGGAKQVDEQRAQHQDDDRIRHRIPLHDGFGAQPLGDRDQPDTHAAGEARVVEALTEQRDRYRQGGDEGAHTRPRYAIPHQKVDAATDDPEVSGREVHPTEDPQLGIQFRTMSTEERQNAGDCRGRVERRHPGFHCWLGTSQAFERGICGRFIGVLELPSPAAPVRR